MGELAFRGMLGVGEGPNRTQQKETWGTALYPPVNRTAGARKGSMPLGMGWALGANAVRETANHPHSDAEGMPYESFAQIASRSCP